MNSFLDKALELAVSSLGPVQVQVNPADLQVQAGQPATSILIFEYIRTCAAIARRAENPLTLGDFLCNNNIINCPAVRHVITLNTGPPRYYAYNYMLFAAPVK